MRKYLERIYEFFFRNRLEEDSDIGRSAEERFPVRVQTKKEFYRFRGIGDAILLRTHRGDWLARYLLKS